MGIRYKLVIPLIITLLVIFIVIHFFLKPRWIEHEYEEYLDQQNVMLETLAVNVTSHILSSDYAQMFDQLDSRLQLKTSNWKALLVQLNDGAQVYPLEKLAEQTLTQYADDQYIEKITHQLEYDDETVGSVTLFADWSGEVFEINERITQIEITLLVCFSFLLMLALTLQSMLIRVPLQQLKNAAGALAHGDYDIELPAAGKDEIGQLSHSFKIMRESIKTHEVALTLAANEAAAALVETEAVHEQLKHTHNEITHFRSALDEHAIVSIADIEGNMTFINEKFCKISGYSAEELVGKNHRMLKSDFHAPEYYKKLRTTVAKGEVWHGEMCSTARNGKQYWVEATVVPFLDEEGKPYKYVAISTDITEKINTVERLKVKTHETNVAHAELKKSHQQALHSEKLASVGQLAAGIAHEINTPVQFVGDNTRFLQTAFDDLNDLIMVYQQLAQAVTEGKPHDELLTSVTSLSEEVEVDYLAEEIPHAITQTLEGIERISKIVLSMKDFSHPGSNHKEVVDINHAIESTITVSRNEWKYNAELNTDFDEKLIAVPCYVGEFNQVILNIIINACHAIADARQGDKLGTIKISTRLEEQFAVVCISDTGTGMPDSVKKKIFEPFFTTKGVGKGSGQGLAIAYAVIVEKHGGSLAVESTPGEGTTFIIRLPMQTAANDDETENGMYKKTELKQTQDGLQ